MADTETKYVYFFGQGKAEGSAQMKPDLGGKGANLAEMVRGRYGRNPALLLAKMQISCRFPDATTNWCL